MAEEELRLEAEAAAEEKIIQLEKEIEDLTEKWKRMAADYANLERRVSREKETVTKYANILLLVKMFPVLDNLEKAAAAAPTDPGLTAIVRQFQAILDREGVTRIPALGEKFNPLLHECIDVVAGDGDEKVVAILREGYKMEDRVLRPAQVRVSRKPTDGNEDAKPGDQI